MYPANLRITFSDKYGWSNFTRSFIIPCINKASYSASMVLYIARIHSCMHMRTRATYRSPICTVLLSSSLHGLCDRNIRICRFMSTIEVAVIEVLDSID